MVHTKTSVHGKKMYEILHSILTNYRGQILYESLLRRINNVYEYVMWQRRFYIFGTLPSSLSIFDVSLTKNWNEEKGPCFSANTYFICLIAYFGYAQKYVEMWWQTKTCLKIKTLCWCAHSYYHAVCYFKNITYLLITLKNCVLISIT